mmetsp:Transcript_40628/g.91322  ORF Transcript_40628/g.91322 Transcript_40628/m.91322 type:complete len:177 (-) Transcript_40628:265-795(-)
MDIARSPILQSCSFFARPFFYLRVPVSFYFFIDELLLFFFFCTGAVSFVQVPEEIRSLGLDPLVGSGQIIQCAIPLKAAAAAAASPMRRREGTSPDGGGGEEEEEEETFGAAEKPTYVQLFDLLLINYEAVVVAVYRSPSEDNDMPYISMPQEFDTLEWTDKLFVVAPPHQIQRLL